MCVCARARERQCNTPFLTHTPSRSLSRSLSLSLARSLSLSHLAELAELAPNDVFVVVDGVERVTFRIRQMPAPSLQPQLRVVTTHISA